MLGYFKLISSPTGRSNHLSVKSIKIEKERSFPYQTTLAKLAFKFQHLNVS